MGGEEGSYEVRVIPKVNGIEVCWIVWAGKEVLDCFRSGVSRAGWAVGGERGIDGVEVILEFGTIVGSELGEDGSVVPREWDFGGVMSGGARLRTGFGG